MNLTDVRFYRLLNLLIANPEFKTPAEIVESLCAMQSQVYPMAKWAIGLRAKGLKDSDVEKDFNEGKILRTHILRPTWHFVSPADIKWMLKLSAPRVHAFNAYMYRKYHLEKMTFNKSIDIITRSITGNNYRTRTELKNELSRSKLNGDTVWLSCILMYAELEGIICSGPKTGKQFTYALMDERVKKSKNLPIDESLAELVKRYFKSRGPATVRDFVWWSGLTVTQAKKGIASLAPEITSTTIDNEENYFYKTAIPRDQSKLRAAFLMPDYDEFGISYKDRTALKNIKIPAEVLSAKSTVYSHWLVLNGTISGTWSAGAKENKAEIFPFIPLSRKDEIAAENALMEYNLFFES